MNNKKNGSAVLLVILVLSVILIYMSGQWYTTQSVIEIVVNKKRMFKMYHTAKSLLDYAVSICCNNYDKLVEVGEKKEFNLDSSQWPFKNKLYSAHITIQPKTNAVKLRVAIVNNDDIVNVENCIVSCHVDSNNNSKTFFEVKVL